MESIWTKQVKMPRFEALSGDIRTDVLVIGGGIAGVLCASQLKNAGIDCVVAEAGSLCGGVTRYTTAKITCQHGLIYHKIARRYGTETARLYYRAQKEALEAYAVGCRGVDCDFSRQDSYVYSLDSREKIQNEVVTLNKIGCTATFESGVNLPFSVAGAVKMENQAQFHPLKFLQAIARDLKIYEHTRVLEVTPDGAVTDRGRIFARKIIMATHFPFFNKYGGYFLKMYQHRSYVIALENAPDVGGMYVDEADKGLSFRNVGNLLLLGGGGHRTGQSGGNWKELEQFAEKHYPGAKEVGRWATQDCKTLDDMPYIGLYSPRTPNVYVATGFNKWGMTEAMTAAMVLADLVQGKDNAYAKIFDPARRMVLPQLAANALHSVAGLLTPTVPRCPHLGCALKYNAQEHSWDCPCHGSRFAKDGKLLDGPATGDKKL